MKNLREFLILWGEQGGLHHIEFPVIVMDHKKEKGDTMYGDPEVDDWDKMFLRLQTLRTTLEKQEKQISAAERVIEASDNFIKSFITEAANLLNRECQLPSPKNWKEYQDVVEALADYEELYPL